jgi:Tfp pilus assembly protein PilE
MHKNMRKAQGLTVIELLFIVIVIGVLGSVVAVGYNGIQSSNRNTERRKDIDAIKLQLETYYAKTNIYPTQSNLNDAAWRAANVKLPDGTITDPGWEKVNNFCTLNDKPTLAAEPAVNCYSYQVSSTEGSPCDNSGALCSHYTLTSKLEGGENYTKTSLN